MENAAITLLLIEDSIADQMFFERILRKEAFPYEHIIVSSLAEAKQILQKRHVDIIVVDYMLGDGTAFDISDITVDIPMIMVTNHGDEGIAVRAMKSGFSDYLVKDAEGMYLKVLPIVVENALKHWQTDRELRAYRTHLEELVQERTSTLEAEIQRRKQAEEEKNRLLQQLQQQNTILIRRRREADTLRMAIQALSSTLDLQQVFELILSELQEVVPYDSASVQQLTGNYLEIIGGRGFPNLDELLAFRFDLTVTDNPNREVVDTRSPVIIEDAPKIYKKFHRKPHAQAHTRSWLGVPLLFGDRLLGMIALDKREPGFYTREHAQLAQAFAAQAAVAIENARMFTELKQAEAALLKMNEELEQRVEERTVELKSVNVALQTSLDTLQKTQVRLVQSEMLAALGGLVAGVSHEINNPVGIGVTAASYLQQQSQEIGRLYHEGKMTRPDLEKYLNVASESSDIILGNLRRAAELIQSFKQVAVDRTSGERRLFNLKDYIGEILLSLHPKLKKTEHTVITHCPDDVNIQSFPGAFSQIISNLVLNSLMHGFERKNQGEIRLDVTVEQGTLLMRYSDNGRGMSAQEVARIFEPFYTTKRGQGGSGLGLHIVYNLVTQRLKGIIECESLPGAGTTFIIQIPMHQETTDNE